MKCPRCNTNLKENSIKGFLQLKCPTCEGILIKRMIFIKKYYGKISNIFSEAIRKIGLKTFTPYNIKCPNCRKNFLQVPIVFNGINYPIDLCIMCDQIWLDKEEVDNFYKTTDNLNLNKLDPILEVKIHKFKYDMEKDRDIEINHPSSLLDFSGLLIEEDNNYISEPPFLTFSIVGLCVLFSIFNWIFNQNNYTFGLVPNEAFRYLGLTFFTSFFIHGSILHLLGNMYFLVLLGRSIEYEIGREKALFLLILASLFGDMVDIIVRYESYIPSIGASGGIAGYLTYYCLKFRNNKLKIPLPSISIGESRYWKIKAVYFALIWVIIELIGITSNTNINHTVHLAGGFIGVLAYYYLEEYS